jgi:hypothetical protein
MNIRLGLRDNRTSYRPSEDVEGAVLWEAPETPKLAEVRLLWFTRGKGTEDLEVVATETFSDPQPGDTRTFKLRLPEGPYSFNGRLIALIWAVEFVLEPGDHAERIELVMAPNGREVSLAAVQPQASTRAGDKTISIAQK